MGKLLSREEDKVIGKDFKLFINLVIEIEF